MTPILGITASSITSSTLGSFESIASVTVGSGGASDIVFSNIAQTYTHLQARFMIRNGNTAGARMRVRLNSDSGSNYAVHLLSGDGSSVISAAATSATQTLGSATTKSTLTASTFAVGIIDILDYQNTNKNKTLRQITGAEYNTNDAEGNVSFWSGLWMNTAAVTALTFFVDNSGNFAANSTIALYGIK